jgi:hypothetical protein
MDLHTRAREKTVSRLDEHATARDVDDHRVTPWLDTSRAHAVFGDRT